MDQQRFTLEISSDMLADLDERLARTRWPNEAGDGQPGTGPSLASMRALIDYWRDGFDWEREQAALNEFAHFTSGVDGRSMHYIHERSSDPEATALVLLHGWVNSFAMFRHVIAPLAAGADGVPTFHVIVPSLPGFDFSEQPDVGELSAEGVAAQVSALIEGLGYDRYVLHGGDWGGVVAQEVARSHPDRIVGLHLTDIPFPNLFLVDRAEVTEEEKSFLEGVDAWGEKDGAYVSIQSTRPLTLSYGLSDSPVGLAGWLRDHFERLVTTPISDDDFLTNVMLYWARGSIRSSMRLYSEGAAWEDDADWGSASGGGSWEVDASAGDAPTDASWSASGADGTDTAGEWSSRIEVPTALQVFPDDIAPAPRAFAERFFDVRRYTREPVGGHFAALEVPEAVVADIRSFVADLT